VENVAHDFDLSRIPDYGLLLYLAVGILITALMQSSSASIAIALTALNTQLITFNMGVAMVIGANVGTTVTVLLGSIGGTQAKKRVAASHLIFNVITGIIAFLSIPGLVWIVKLIFDIQSNSVMGLALFHTLFNFIGVLLFLPFIGLLARQLIRLLPDQKAMLNVFLDNTPTEVTDAATAALKKEILHLLLECQFYNLRLLHIDEKLVFDQDSPFEIFKKKKIPLVGLYENIKLLHAEIFAFYSRLQAHKLEVHEARENERAIFASRNIMNSIKNFKGIGQDLDEFDASGNSYLNSQYKLFRKRLVELYHDMNRIQRQDNREEQYRLLLQTFLHIETADKQLIRETMAAVSNKQIKEIEIASLLLVNRLFTQSCRMQIFSMKDLLLTAEQISNFDRALDMKEIMEEEKAKARENN
jgi:phosphate:Na+ symporter